MMISDFWIWLRPVLLLLLAMLYLSSVRYSRLWAIPLYALVSLSMSFIYWLYLPASWHFYLINNLVVAVLYLLMYVQIRTSAGHRLPAWYYLTFFTLAVLPFLPYRIDFLSSLASVLINSVIVLDLAVALKSRHPILPTLSFFSFIGLVTEGARLVLDAGHRHPFISIVSNGIWLLFVLLMCYWAVKDGLRRLKYPHVAERSATSERCLD